MQQDTKAIANGFISQALESELNLDVIKLQKLIYYAHGWHLAITKMPLIREPIQAHKFGIVIPSIYLASRQYGLAKLESLYQEFKIESGHWIKPMPAHLSLAAKLINKLGMLYGQTSTIELINLTQRQEAPWAQCRAKKSRMIDDALMTQFFASVANIDTKEPGQSFFNINIDDVRVDCTALDNTPSPGALEELSHYEKSARDFEHDGPARTWKKVIKHRVGWDHQRNCGNLSVLLEDKVEYKLQVRSPRELRTIINMFKNENHVLYDLLSGALASEWKFI